MQTSNLFAGMEKNSIYICGEYRILLLDKEFSRRDLDVQIRAYMALYGVQRKELTFQFFGGGKWHNVGYKDLYKIDHIADAKVKAHGNRANEKYQMHKESMKAWRAYFKDEDISLDEMAAVDEKSRASFYERTGFDKYDAHGLLATISKELEAKK